MRPIFAVAIASCLFLTGCAVTPTAESTADTGNAIRGRAFGGQQPIVGAHIYLLAANTTGYGGQGIAASASNASLSLLTMAQTDSIGSYVTTGQDGSFSITGDYTCTANTQVYLYALGGNPGAGANAAAGLLAAMGNCPASGSFLPATPFVIINEVTTVAAAYAMAGFASDATHVSSSGTTQAKTGIQNAFANAAQLSDVGGGTARTVTPGGNGAVPQAEINTIANILASCINSTGPASTSCSTLLGDARAGGSTGTVPADTATAAINIAHNPGVNTAALYALSMGTPPFSPALTLAPNDFAIAINFTGGGIGVNGPNAIAIDASSNVWVVTINSNTVSKFSPSGVAISPSAGYTGGGLGSPNSIAIDSSGNAWVANNGSGISEFSNSGNALSPLPLGYTGGGISGPAGVAIDAAGNVWIANDTSFFPCVSKFSSSGVHISGNSGYTGGGVYNAVSVAIDASGNAWFADDENFANLSEFSTSGAPVSPTGGYGGGGLVFPGPIAVAIDASGNIWAATSVSLAKFSSTGTPISPSTGYTGGGIANPQGLAIDGAGNAWLANYNNSSVSEFSKTGTAITPSKGYTAVGGLSLPYGIAIDSSGNVWVPAIATKSVAELIGAATPVITPLVAGVKNNTIATAP